MPQWPADHVERRATADLAPYARNARTHSEDQVAQLASAILQWGWTNPILIDEDGTIIAGHGRVLAAQSLGLTDVPVMIARGWSDTQKRAYGIADNKLALNAGWDEHLLAAELIEVGGDLRPLIGFSADELRELSIGVTETDMPDIPEGERGDFRGMTFVLHVEQETIIKLAIEAAKRAGPFDGPNPNSNGNALARICASYLECQTLKQSASLQ